MIEVKPVDGSLIYLLFVLLFAVPEDLRGKLVKLLWVSVSRMVMERVKRCYVY